MAMRDSARLDWRDDGFLARLLANTVAYVSVAQAFSLPTRHSCRVLRPAHHQASRRVSTRQPERLRHRLSAIAYS
jgi:hypothetical protein